MDTLVLDRNPKLELGSIPPLPNLRILYMNFCDITSLTKCVYHLSSNFPDLTQLSLLGNPIANSFLERCSPITPHDYRMFVIFLMKKLQVLDDKAITAEERQHASDFHSTLYFKECPYDEELERNKLNLVIEHLGLETIDEERSRDLSTTPETTDTSSETSSIDLNVGVKDLLPVNSSRASYSEGSSSPGI